MPGAVVIDGPENRRANPICLSSAESMMPSLTRRSPRLAGSSTSASAVRTAQSRFDHPSKPSPVAGPLILGIG
jgi:hypothetical protein